MNIPIKYPFNIYYNLFVYYLIEWSLRSMLTLLTRISRVAMTPERCCLASEWKNQGQFQLAEDFHEFHIQEIFFQTMSRTISPHPLLNINKGNKGSFHEEFSYSSCLKVISPIHQPLPWRILWLGRVGGGVQCLPLTNRKYVSDTAWSSQEGHLICRSVPLAEIKRSWGWRIKWQGPIRAGPTLCLPGSNINFSPAGRTD